MLAERLGAPVIKAILGKEVIPDDSPYCVGGTGVVGTSAATEVLSSCNAFVIIGSSFPYIEFLPKPGQCVAIQIDACPERIGLRYPVDIGLAGDAQATLRELLTFLPRNDDRSFLASAQASTRAWWSLMEERGTRDDVPMKPQVVTWALSQLLDDDAIVCGDSGTVTTLAARMKLRANQRSRSAARCARWQQASRMRSERRSPTRRGRSSRSPATDRCRWRWVISRRSCSIDFRRR